MGFPNFIETLYDQARISQKIIAFAYNSVLGPSSGTCYLGGYNASKAGGPLIEYPVELDTGYWSYQLSKITVNNTILGYNGLTIIDTGFSYAIVPMTLFNLLLQLILPPGAILTRTAFPSYDLVTFNCSATSYPNMPNITYYLDGAPFVLTPYQYISALNPSAPCTLGIVGARANSSYAAPYTLGTLAFNGTLSVYDLANRTLSVAPLNPN